jgi:hypothetical protein
MNPMFNALAGHTPTQERYSKAYIRKNFEQAWQTARVYTIEAHGMTSCIVLGSIYLLEARARTKIISDVQFNNLHSIVTAAQTNLAQIYQNDPRAAVLHARIVEAHNKHAGSGWRSF